MCKYANGVLTHRRAASTSVEGRGQHFIAWRLPRLILTHLNILNISYFDIFKDLEPRNDGMMIGNYIDAGADALIVPYSFPGNLPDPDHGLLGV
jgi:hypothetical protein